MKRGRESTATQSSRRKPKKNDLVDKMRKVVADAVTKEETVCSNCEQLFSEVKVIDQEDETTWFDELQTLTDPELILPSDDPTNAIPQHKITDYVVYASCGHLVSFDEGLIEEGREVFLRGWVKQVFCDNEDQSGGLPTKDIGPITEWWFSGFDGGENIIVGLETAYASYVLAKPHESYSSFTTRMTDKLYLSKLVIEFQNKNSEASFEDLLHAIRDRSCDRFDEESLLRHSNFIIQQIMSYDEAGDEDEIKILETSAISDFMDLCGITDFSGTHR